MALLSYALGTVAELKAYASLSGTNQDTQLENALNAATELVEQRADRQLVSRGTLQEYHSLRHFLSTNREAINRDDRSRYEIRTGEWPIISVTSVYESIPVPRIYDATTLLTASQYEIVKPKGVIRRLETIGPWPWWPGHHAIQLNYAAGYQATDGTPAQAIPIPWDLKQAALFIAASIFKESNRQQWGVSSQSDALGNVTRFMGYIPPSMADILASHARQDFDRTWERMS
jgi:hypothetical protein